MYSREFFTLRRGASAKVPLFFANTMGVLIEIKYGVAKLDSLSRTTYAHQRAAIMGRRTAIHDRAFDPGEFHSRIAKLRTVVATSKGQAICDSERLADYWWQVESGAVRQASLQSNGLRCIHEFFLPHEWFVCDSISDDLAIEAICDGTVLGRYRRFDLECLAAENVAIAQILRDAHIRQTARAEGHIRNLWHQRSVEKVRVFLDQMSARMPARSDGCAHRVIATGYSD